MGLMRSRPPNRLTRRVCLGLVSLAALGIGSCKSATVVSQPTCVDVRLDVTSLNPRVGETSHVGATGITAGGVPVSGSTFQWLSRNTAVATVNQQGVVTAISVGTATIDVVCTSATGALVTSSVVITVRPALVRLVVNAAGNGNGSFSVDPPGSEFETGTPVDVTATPAQGSIFDGFAGPCVVSGQTCSVTMTPPGPVVVTGTFTLCDRSYCGTINAPFIFLNWQRVGFSYTYDGYVDLTFDPAPRAGIRMNARLNAQSISGTASTTGDTSLRIPLAGTSIACTFVNPSTLVITDFDNPIPALAIITITWDSPGCGATMARAGSEVAIP